jgi:hypothetical protein
VGLLSKSADYTDKDFDSWRRRARSLIVSVFPDWTDDKTPNFGNIIVELQAHLLDIISKYQDNQAIESRITTAVLRKNILAAAKLVNYTPEGAGAATASVTFTLAAAVASGRTVTFNPPANPTPTNATVVTTEDVENPVTFQLLSPVVITAGNSSGVGIVENSTRQGPENFSSTGLPNQRFALESSPYLPDSLTITADDGTYTEVDNFLQSTSASKHFVVVIDDLDAAEVVFGNGTNGSIPVGTIVANYKTGGGASGIVTANTIKKIEGSFVDSAGSPITVTVNNAQASTGGVDREGNEEIRENAPLSIRAVSRTVARDDFEIHATGVAGVERALMITKEQDGSVPENSGKIFIVPAGTGFPTIGLKNEVLTAVKTTYPHTLTFSPSAVDPIYVDIGIKATLFLKPGYVAATVRANILQACKDFFALRDSDGVKNPLIDFGYNLKNAAGTPAGEMALSDLFNVVRDVDGIREIGDSVNDFQLKAYRVIVTTDGYTSGSFPSVLVQAYAHTDVPINNTDFPRLKSTVLGGAILDIDLTIDGVNYPPA